MHQVVLQSILAQLTYETLERMPCAWDYPDRIQFRIGLSELGQIKFEQETEDLYYLKLKGNDERYVELGISTSSPNYNRCKEIYNDIRKLTLDKTYNALKDNPESLGVMIETANNLVKSFLDRLGIK